LDDLPCHGDQIAELGKWILGEYEKSQKSFISLVGGKNASLGEMS
jgi:hypothetical protein